MVNRAERMVERTPAYYQYSAIFYAIQNAIAQDLDAREADQQDTSPQLFIMTATWGLKYWEEIMGLPTILTDSFEVRRSRVLAAWRGIGNFGVDLIEAIISAYTEEPVRVWVDVGAYEVVVELTTDFPDFAMAGTQIANIVHAHLGVKYRLRTKFPVNIGHSTKAYLHLSDKTNFWTRLASSAIRWDGEYNWDGGLTWNGHQDLNGTEFLTTQRHVVVCALDLKVKNGPGVDQQWNGGFFFNGTRTWGGFSSVENFKHDAITLIRTQGSNVMERTVL